MPTPTASPRRPAAAGVTVRYAFADGSLGRVVVAATDRGVCAVEIGDADEALAAGLAARFPGADLRPDDSGVSPLAAAVAAALDAPAGWTPPLDIRGTALQRRVWDELRRVPAGETVTYAELARRVGRPDAVRAVAGACAANPVAVLVPCHRVVPAAGGLGGYRWGIERKRKLLDREAAAHKSP